VAGYLLSTKALKDVLENGKTAEWIARLDGQDVACVSVASFAELRSMAHRERDPVKQANWLRRIEEAEKSLFRSAVIDITTIEGVAWGMVDARPLPDIGTIPQDEPQDLSTEEVILVATALSAGLTYVGAPPTLLRAVLSELNIRIHEP
jgi:predicted nucleic acid-binding protein